jgi:hypothetical protein
VGCINLSRQREVGECVWAGLPSLRPREIGPDRRRLVHPAVHPKLEICDNPWNSWRFAALFHIEIIFNYFCNYLSCLRRYIRSTNKLVRSVFENALSESEKDFAALTAICVPPVGPISRSDYRCRSHELMGNR